MAVGRLKVCVVSGCGRGGGEQERGCETLFEPQGRRGDPPSLPPSLPPPPPISTHLATTRCHAVAIAATMSADGPALAPDSARVGGAGTRGAERVGAARAGAGARDTLRTRIEERVRVCGGEKGGEWR